MDSTAGVDSGPAGSLRGRPWLVLTLVCLVVSLTGIGLSIMSVAFPAIAAEFPDASPAELSWVANVFTIVGAATLIPAGVLADRWGRKRMLLLGTALFTVGSLVAGFAPGPEWLVAARGLQSLGASAYTP
ncbi:MAG: MFS transporter, partial [Acidimicrobiales bacterium]|nr:MFS transporter [Acidimicrobiales bacterium]